ncbi:MAG: Gx transporter family protein [Bacillota bacterium]
MTTRRLTTIAILTAMAIVLHLVESLFPAPLPIPGVKLGLANIITIIALVLVDWKAALSVAVLRTVIGSLLSGTFFSVTFILSFSGAILAALIMVLIYLKFPKFSIIGISIAGAVMHNIAQLGAAALIIDQPGIYYYLPVLLIAAIPTGIITGLLASLLCKRLKKS